LALFAKAYLCGILIHLAVTIKQDLITVLCVMGFILIGAEHCIADFPYLLINISFVNIIKYLIVVLGNTAGALFLQQLLTEGS
jgi:formate/nitrite transporter FocA (FNT family)